MKWKKLPFPEPYLTSLYIYLHSKLSNAAKIRILLCILVDGEDERERKRAPDKNKNYCWDENNASTGGNQSHTRVNIQPWRHKWHTRNTQKNHIIHRELSSGPVIEWNENKKLKRVRELSVRTHSNSNTQDEMKWKFLLNLFTYFSLRLGLIWNSPPRLGVFPYKYSKNQHRLFSLCHVSNISFVPFSAVPSFIWNSRNAHKKNEREERKRERWDLEKYSTHWDDTILFHPSRPCLQVCCVLSWKYKKIYTLLLSFGAEGNKDDDETFFLTILLRLPRLRLILSHSKLSFLTLDLCVYSFFFYVI